MQYAALPYRLGGSSRAEIMLITSRDTQRWVIPKGWPQKGKAPHRSAAREAFEEAGIIGAISRSSVGSFVYKKRLKDGRFIVCDVEVFPLKVKRQTKKMAGEPATSGQVAPSERSGRGRARAHIAKDHPPPGARDRLTGVYIRRAAQSARAAIAAVMVALRAGG